MTHWNVYIVRCSDGSLYTGITNDLAARVDRHHTGKGARYTRSRRPVTLVWKRRAKDKPTALKLEWAMKQLSRAEKLALLTPPRQAGARRPRRRPSSSAAR